MLAQPVGSAGTHGTPTYLTSGGGGQAAARAATCVRGWVVLHLGCGPFIAEFHDTRPMKQCRSPVSTVVVAVRTAPDAVADGVSSTSTALPAATGTATTAAMATAAAVAEGHHQRRESESIEYWLVFMSCSLSRQGRLPCRAQVWQEAVPVRGGRGMPSVSVRYPLR